jgi:hypothetical protein
VIIATIPLRDGIIPLKEGIKKKKKKKKAVMWNSHMNMVLKPFMEY